MELEDLKNLWKQNEPAYQAKNEEEIAHMMRGKSKSIIDKLKQSVWFELLFTIVAGAALLIYALMMPSGAAKWTAIALLVMCIGYTFYYVKKLLLLQRYPLTNDNLHKTLSVLIENLSGYLKFYKRSYTILYPVYFFLGLLFGVLERGASEYLNFLSRWTTILSILALAGLFYFMTTWFANWYLKKLYGNHLERLKALYLELEGYQSPS